MDKPLRIITTLFPRALQNDDFESVICLAIQLVTAADSATLADATRLLANNVQLALKQQLDANSSN